MKMSVKDKIEKAIHCASMSSEDKILYEKINQIYNNALPYVCEDGKYSWKKRCKAFENLYINVKDEDMKDARFEQEKETTLGLLNDIYEILAYQAEKKPDTQTLLNKIKEVYPKSPSFFIDYFCEYSKDCADLYKKAVIDVEEAEMANKVKSLKSFIANNSGDCKADDSIDSTIIKMSNEISDLNSRVFHHKFRLEELESRQEAVKKEQTPKQKAL